MNMSSQKLAVYKWKHRIIVLVSDSFASATIQEQHQLFMTKKQAMTERDLILFLTDGTTLIDDQGGKTTIDIAELYRTARISSDFTGVLLFGKDGGYTLKKDFVLDPQVIFDLVDAMPMRQFEMKNTP